MSSEEEKLARYYKYAEKAETGNYPIRANQPDGSIEVGGRELLPTEQSFNFGDIKERLSNLKNFKTVYEVVEAILDDKTIKVPLAIEVGREGQARGEISYLSDSPFFRPRIREKIKVLFDVNIIGLLIAGGANYVQCGVEKLSTIFTNGHRGNFMYLGQVLTNDGQAADLSTLEKIQHIIEEINKSMMPDGVVVIWNQDTDLQSKDFEENGFEVLLDSGGIFVLRKI